jgi:hypothetical protein
VQALTFANAKLEGYQFRTTDGRLVQIVWNQTDTELPNPESIPYSPNAAITSATDSIGNPVAAPNNTVNVNTEPRFIFLAEAAPTPTPTTVPVPCTPRPPVTTAVAPGGGRLTVTLTVGTGPGAATNHIRELRFGPTTNALVDIPSGPTGASGTFTFAPPGGPGSVSFAVRRAAPGQSTTVPVVVVDDCGLWPTFVGGGPTAF